MCLLEKPNPRQTLMACKGVFYFNGDVNSGVNIWRHEKMRGLCIFYRHADECLYIADKYLTEDESWHGSGVNLYAKLALGQRAFGRGVIGLQCPWWEQTFSEKFCCESYEHYLEARNVELKNEAQQLRLEMQANTSSAQDLQQQHLALQGQVAAMEASMGQMALEKQKLERELMDARSLAASTPASTAPPSWSTASSGMTVEQQDRLKNSYALLQDIHQKLQQESEAQKKEVLELQQRLEELQANQPSGSAGGGAGKADSWLKTGWLNRCVALSGAVHLKNLERCQELIKKLFGLVCACFSFTSCLSLLFMWQSDVMCLEC